MPVLAHMKNHLKLKKLGEDKREDEMVVVVVEPDEKGG